jgi:hypothetical protein
LSRRVLGGAAVVAAATVALAPAAGAAPAAPLFRLSDPRITEASGIAVGHRGVDYVQNDSGDANRFFAVDARTGATVAAVTVAGARNVDWEDIATGPDAAGVPSVWIADTGDNDAVRAEVRLYRVREPRLARNQRGRTLRTARADVWRLQYPGGPADAEGLAVDPHGVPYVVTKSALGRSTVFRVPGGPDAARVRTLQPVGRVTLVPRGTPNPFGPFGELTVTGAAFSPDGRVFAVRTYAAAYLWPVTDGGLGAALRRSPVRVALPRQPQGEGIALAGGRTALVDSEGRDSAVYAVRLPALAADPRPRPSSTPAPGRGSATASAPAARRPGDSGGGPWPWEPFAIAGGVVLLGAAVWAARRGRIGA